MLLGKRPRQLMKRTTSMTEMTIDLNANVGGSASAPQSDPQNPSNPQRQAGQGMDHQRFLATASPRNHRRTTAEIFESQTASFLRSCSLCKRRLVPGRDIYMYRGDSAFCSLECRQQQINQDERMENCSLASKKLGAAASSSTKGPQVSTEGETVAAL